MQAKSIQQNDRNLDVENMDKTGIEKQTNKQKTVAISQEAEFHNYGITNCTSKMKMASNLEIPLKNAKDSLTFGEVS